MVGTVIQEADLSLIRDWFAIARVASLELPNGWFGRPYDGQYYLSRVELMADRLLVELSGEMLLLLAHPTSVVGTTEFLEIVAVRNGVLSWDEFGSGRPLIEDVGSGNLRFHPPQVRRR